MRKRFLNTVPRFAGVLVAVDLSEHGGRAIPYAYGIVNSGGIVRLLLLDTDPIARDAMLADRCNVAFAGTLRLIGVAFGVSMVVAFEKRLRARAETGRGSGHALEPAAHRI